MTVISVLSGLCYPHSVTATKPQLRSASFITSSETRAISITYMARFCVSYEDPFGDILVSSGALADENPFRFSSKYHDDETGLVYYGFRDYSPGLGRWTSRDPIGQQGGWNVYAFVANAALDRWDPLGKKPFIVIGGDWENFERDLAVQKGLVLKQIKKIEAWADK